MQIGTTSMVSMRFNRGFHRLVWSASAWGSIGVWGWITQATNMCFLALYILCLPLGSPGIVYSLKYRPSGLGSSWRFSKSGYTTSLQRLPKLERSRWESWPWAYLVPGQSLSSEDWGCWVIIMSTMASIWCQVQTNGESGRSWEDASTARTVQPRTVIPDLREMTSTLSWDTARLWQISRVPCLRGNWLGLILKL